MTVRREPSGSMALRLRAARDGRFTARLSPGRYLLQPRNSKPFPRASSQVVRVAPDRFTQVTIRFDSGIR